MADTKEILVRLKVDETSNEEADVSNQVNTSNESATKNDKSKGSKALATYLVTQSLSMVTSEVVSWAEYYWNRTLTLTDDYVGQREKNIAMTQINRAISFASTIGSTAATGALFGGPWGAVAGAIVGAISGTVSIVRSDIQGKDQQDIAIRQANAQLDFTRARAGWSTSAASIGDNL